MARPGEALAHLAQGINGAVAVMAINGVRKDEDQGAVSLSQDAVLMAFDPRPRIARYIECR